MKRIPLLLLPVLLFGLLVPFGSPSLAAGAVTGAAFTTVNTAVDGAGHCRNGNPPVNCNIYTGKPYVWLNGGPAASQLRPAGRFFFAVLAPGGQLNANDGSPKNLSDDYGTYASRTFMVQNGNVSSYSGTHAFNRNLIRLAPYANTTNPGGVYILAVCWLGNGYPVKASACKYDQFKVLASAPACTPTAPRTIKANFTNVDVNTPVEGPDTVADYLEIISLNYVNGTRNPAVRVAEGMTPKAYYASGTKGPSTVINGGIDPQRGGFGDPEVSNNEAAASYMFKFRVPVSNFQMEMLDYGDWNPKLGTEHTVVLRAFKAGSITPIYTQTLHYTTPADRNPDLNAPTWSDLFGDLQTNGDALLAPTRVPGTSGMPGRYLWSVPRSGIVRIKLDVVNTGPSMNGQDPNFALDKLSFTIPGGCLTPTATPTP